MSFKFTSKNVISIFQNRNIDNFDKTSSCPELVGEIDNLLSDIKAILLNRSIYETSKYLLWTGLLNIYGIFGFNQHGVRYTNKTEYVSRKFIKGDVVSVDFGTSNFCGEFSYMHGAIVISDQLQFVMVIPMTSIKDYDPAWMTDDTKSTCPILLSSKYPLIQDDSYLLVHQMRCVSKNRITKYIGNLSNTPFILELDNHIKNIMNFIQ